MLFFGNYFGHTDIVIKSTKTGEVEGYIEDVMHDAEPDEIFGYCTTDISPLEPGEYEIYTTDYNHNERSFGTIVTITGDSTMDLVLRCNNASHADADDYIEEEKLDLPKGIAALTYFHKLYCDAEPGSKKLSLAKLLMSMVDMVNHRIEKLGLSIDPMHYDQTAESIFADADTASIRRKELLTGKVQQVVPSFMEGVKMPSDYDGLYLYMGIDEDGIPKEFCFSFCPAPEIYGMILEDETYAKSLYQNAIEKTVDFPKGIVEFTDEEADILAVIRELQPGGPVFHAPSLATSFGKITASFAEEDLKILKAFPDSFYLSINPVEFSLDKDQRIHVKIAGGDTSFYPEQLCISDGDYLYWVEDGYSHIVSDVRYIRANGGSINASSVEQQENDDFDERLRKLRMNQYEKHLKLYADKNYPDAMEKIVPALSYCESENCSTVDIASTVIDKCLAYENKLVLPDIIAAVMRDKTVYGDYVVKFFEKPLRYKYGDSTLAMPPDSNVLYRIERYSYVNGRTVEYFAAKQHEAVDYHFYDCDFAVFSAVDVRTGRSSGFLLFDFDYNREGRTKVTRFLIDALEVQTDGCN